MEHDNPRHIFCQRKGLLQGTIATADNANSFFLEERPIAGGTAGYPLAEVLILPGDTESPGVGTGSDDYSLGSIGLCADFN